MAFKILIADDHEIVRRGLRTLLNSHEGWTVCAEAADGREAVRLADQLMPDLVILDVAMPNLSGLVATRQICRKNPKQQVLILSVLESDQVIKEAFDAGARGFVFKSDIARDLIAAVEALQHHRPAVPLHAFDILHNRAGDGKNRLAAAASAFPSLTMREREVIQLLAEGKTTKEVASLLGVSLKTAETHRSNLMRKLGLHSVSSLVLYAVRNNLVQVEGSYDWRVQ